MFGNLDIEPSISVGAKSSSHSAKTPVGNRDRERSLSDSRYLAGYPEVEGGEDVDRVINWPVPFADHRQIQWHIQVAYPCLL